MMARIVPNHQRGKGQFLAREGQFLARKGQFLEEVVK